MTPKKIWYWKANHALLPTALLSLIYLGYCVLANSAVTQNHSFLFNDEQMAYWNIRGILRADSFGSFIWNAFDASDHRYGRIYYDITAFLAYLPYRLYGESGQIFSTRMIQDFILLTAYIIGIWSCLQKPLYRILALAFLLALPSTGYFSIMPKPEPTVLLFLVAFFCMHVRKGYSFGPHWILFGLSFGAKIAVFPLVPVVFLHAIYLNPGERKPLLHAFLYFLLGWALAVPILFLAPIKPGYFVDYFRWTFGYIDNAADDLSTTPLTWLQYMYADWLDAPWIGRVSFLALASVSIGLLFERCRREKIKALLWDSSVIFAGAGLVLTVAVIFTAKRVWGMYLHVGAVLFVLGMFQFFERKKNPILVKGFWALALLFIGARLYPMHQTFIELSQRDSMPIHIELVQDYEASVDLIKRVSSANKKRITVLFDNFLYKPDSDSQAQVDYFWGEFFHWDKEPDLIFLDRVKEELQDKNPHRRGYPAYLRSKKERGRHLASTSKNCAEGPCYLELASNRKNLIVYSRKGNILGFGKSPYQWRWKN